ncbi:branched-chain amino acid ABC transporter permease [Marispirochaeta aestuarii]|uniref:Branched-chain amino acid ABC transporter permease n=1 Tax=Marispirochaeta aestuarii TaxID=1963862 RepID=A0A1Y1RXL6_9SPIO|nr:ABC transporter permease [Marispirochaeta aestuarii]ORC35110.1 branched-chain amino acid ABC transporter permease [Marispirochaeta aestuarii]
MKRFLRTREFNLIVFIALLMFVVTLRSPGFIGGDNIQRIINDTSILIIVAIGQFFVILSGGIDLSVGSIIAFSGMATGMLNQYYPGLPVGLVLLIGVLIGLILGMINGAIVAFGKVPPIITTLGTMSVFRGFTFVLSKGQWVTAHEMTQSYMDLPHGDFLGITNLIWWALLVSMATYYFSRYTRTGREVYAIGGNKTAARFVGVKEEKINFSIFSISGLLCGLAGVMWTARYAAAVNETATGFELQTVAACVLGGVSIAGGSGAIPGVILGALFLGIINNALPVINLSPFFQMFIQGFVVLTAMFINTLMDKRNQKLLLNRRRQ